eukprot:Awhi_evm2s576
MGVKAIKKAKAAGKEQYLKSEVGDKNALPLDVAGRISLCNNPKAKQGGIIRTSVGMAKTSVNKQFSLNERILAVSQGKVLLYRVHEEDGTMAGLDGGFSSQDGMHTLNLNDCKFAQVNGASGKFRVSSRHFEDDVFFIVKENGPFLDWVTQQCHKSSDSRPPPYSY